MSLLSADVKGSPSRNKAAIADAIVQKFERSREEKQEWETQAYKNIAFYLGYQWLDWDNGTGLIEFAAESGERYHLVHNLIQPVVRINVARVTSHKPWMVALPATNDESDVEAARLGTKLLQYWRRRLFTQTLNTEFATWLAVCGTAFWRVGWDKHAGRSLTARPLAPASEGFFSADSPESPTKSQGASAQQSPFEAFFESQRAS